MIIQGDEVAQWIGQKLDFAPCPPYHAIGLVRNGVFVGGVLFNVYEGSDVHFTAAGTGWTRPFLKALGEYAYGQLGCARMTMITESPKTAQYACRLGGKIEGKMRDHYGKGRDAFIVGVLKDEWRY